MIRTASDKSGHPLLPGAAASRRVRDRSVSRPSPCALARDYRSLYPGIRERSTAKRRSLRRWFGSGRFGRCGTFTVMNSGAACAAERGRWVMRGAWRPLPLTRPAAWCPNRGGTAWRRLFECGLLRQGTPSVFCVVEFPEKLGDNPDWSFYRFSLPRSWPHGRRLRSRGLRSFTSPARTSAAPPGPLI